ncbi:MAG TPA: 16S rRNA (guanine(966)-N(2))-methyltransferase RsmD, partial [Jiangellaceae bacterium]|nr:16S rRNA (guanine(966)-N(2))-methyltransferase RsmD [Jiangellaceae bacterium]
RSCVLHADSAGIRAGQIARDRLVGEGVTRIIAGACRGRRLTVPPGRDTRPTSDRVREAMFSTIESELGPLSGLHVVDLYAGSGALGLEALSRGAEHALLVESEPRAVRAIRTNVAALGLPAEVIHASVARTLAGPVLRPYDLALADPPYDLSDSELTAVLSQLSERWLHPDALVVVERSARIAALLWPDGLTGIKHRRYGDTMLWYGRSAE